MKSVEDMAAYEAAQKTEAAKTMPDSSLAEVSLDDAGLSEQELAAFEAFQANGAVSENSSTKEEPGLDNINIGSARQQRQNLE